MAALLDRIKRGQCPHLQHFEGALEELQEAVPKTGNTAAFDSLCLEHPELLNETMRIVSAGIEAVARESFQWADDVVPLGSILMTSCLF
jgi:hypothetical protein